MWTGAALGIVNLIVRRGQLNRGIFDAAQWASATLFSRDGTDVDAPATMHAAGYYPDAVAFLNGWGSQADLNTRINAAWSIR